MKKKSKAGLLGSKWVMRYFVLYQDGRLAYYHEKSEVGNTKKSEVLCNNVGECTIDVVKASDLAGRMDSVANSFYITGKGRSKRTLLVTNGPKDFKLWMKAFNNMKVEMLNGVGSGVDDTPDKNDSPERDEKNKRDEENNSRDKEVVPLQISFTSDENNTTQASPDGKPPVVSQNSVRFAEDVDTSNRELKDDQDAKSVTFSFQDAEAIREAVAGDEKSVTFSDRSVTFSDRDDVISGDRSVTFSDYDDEIILNADIEGDDRDDVISGDRSVTFSDIDNEIILVDAGTGDDRSVTFSDRDDVISRGSVTFSDCDDEIILSAGIPGDGIVSNGVSWKDEVIDISAVQEADRRAANEAAPELNEQERGEDADKMKVFAFGDFYDEMVEALDEDKALFGIITTSVEDLLDDEAYVRTESKRQHSELAPISIQYVGPNEEVGNYNNRLHEIESFCERHCSDDKLISVVYSDKNNTRNHILTRLGQAHQDEVDPIMTPVSPSSVSQKAAEVRTMRLADTGGLTAYKHALNVQGADGVPDGNALLKIVRDPRGTPYNWVLFKSSKDELIIEDGGSGGIMELANVVHRDYNDRVLFGLARVSFAGDLGLRHFYCALEWKGENVSGVKALKSYNDSLAPMADRIGDRTFTLSNSSATDLSPQIVVDFVKKSCNVEFTVQALEHAHEKEQKAIEEYWDKLEAKEKAKQDAINAEKLKREEEKREARLQTRTSKLADTKGVREKRKKKWSKLNAPDLLEDLGKDHLSGWVLLQANSEK